MKEKELNSVKFLKEVESSPSTGHISTLSSLLRSRKHCFEDYKAYRNFNQGDRVKVFFEDKWYLGKVVSKYFEEKNKPPYIIIKTDEKVEDDPHGFSLKAPVNATGLIFANEKIPGKKIYHTEYKWKFNPREEEILKKRDEDFGKNCPF